MHVKANTVALPARESAASAEYRSVSDDLERAFADEVTAGGFGPDLSLKVRSGSATRGAHSSSQSS